MIVSSITLQETSADWGSYGGSLCVLPIGYTRRVEPLILMHRNGLKRGLFSLVTRQDADS